MKDPQQWQLKRFVDGLKNLIATIQNRGVNLPILILERTEVGQMFKTPEVSSLVEKRIKKSLKDILGCDRGDFFFTETQQSAPIPLLSPKEHHDLYPTGVPDFAKTMENFILKLKNAGLNLALIAGSNFGGTEYFESIYHDAEFNPSDGLFARSKWKLRDFYNQKLYGEAKHPFQIITPRGCMADVIRSLAKWGEGIKFGVTQATYPQQMPRTDQLVRPPSPYNLTYWQATN